MTNGEMYDHFVKDLIDRQQKYDKETERLLKEVANSEWHTTKYLREILWELRYARRMANRP